MTRSIKIRGGLTRGRGFTDTVRLMWVYSAHACGEIHNAMTSLTWLLHRTSEQHIELGQSRIKRDNDDLRKIQSWFDQFEPFDPNESNLKSLSSGLVASDESGVNCDKVEEIGEAIQKSLDKVALRDAAIKRKEQVKTLESLQVGIEIDKDSVHIDPMILFARLMVLLQREEDPDSYFAYELTSVPTVTFKDNMMRKANKSLLTRALISNIPSQHTDNTSTQYVLDGGALLHRVRWLPNSTYNDVVKQYLQYVYMKFGQSCIVFDGYESANIKDHEHLRRTGKTSADIQVRGDKAAFNSQVAFLSNTHNKAQFIKLLGRSLVNEGHEVKYSGGDADTLFASTALQMASSDSRTTVVADDADVLVILLYHWNDTMSDVLFRSEAKKDSKNVVPVYSINDILTSLGHSLQSLILFIHAWSGCDTTSSTYGHGKASTLKRFKKSKPLQQTYLIFGML